MPAVGLYCVCPRCARMEFEVPPHGDDPCPFVVEEFEREQRRRDEDHVAYLAMLAEQKLSYLRSGRAVKGMARVISDEMTDLGAAGKHG